MGGTTHLSIMGEVKLKLFINKRDGKVLYAEARKEFVDLLAHLLVLPVGVVIGLVENASSASSLGSLYNSFKNLDSNYFNHSKEFILSAPYVGSDSSLLGDSVSSALKNLYVCPEIKSERCIRQVATDGCCSYCDLYPRSWADTRVGSRFCWKDGYVNCVPSYMVMDNLAVMPVSTDTCIELLSSINLNSATDVERKVISVGKDQVIKLLKASLQSKTVLTDVFVRK